MSDTDPTPARPDRTGEIDTSNLINRLGYALYEDDERATADEVLRDVMALAAEGERMRAVVEAAVLWRNAWDAPAADDAAKEKLRLYGLAEARSWLIAAVDDYLAPATPAAVGEEEG